MQTDASKTGLGATCKGVRIGGAWSKEEQKLHNNILELLAVKLALVAFTKNQNLKSVHFQIDNTTVLSYLLKIAGTRNHSLIQLSKDIWSILLTKEITITAEYLPSLLNVVADQESRMRDSTEWKLLPKVFAAICKRWDTITRPVCFTGEPPNPRLCSVEARPIQPRDRCISTGLVKSIPVCIPAILPAEQSIKQSTTRSGPKNDISNTNLAHTAMVSRVTEDEHRESYPTSKDTFIIKKSCGGDPSFSKKWHSAVSGMDNLRAKLCDTGLSKTASQLILECRRPSS